MQFRGSLKNNENITLIQLEIKVIHNRDQYDKLFSKYYEKKVQWQLTIPQHKQFLLSITHLEEKCFTFFKRETCY